MKVYVVKRPDGKYLTEMMDFTDKLIFANLFVDVESAWAYAPNDCRAVECFFMERNERTDYAKQVRKEVVDELCDMLTDRAELIETGGVAEFMFTTYDLKESIKQIQGEDINA